MAGDDEPESVEVRYEKDEDYRTLPASDVTGGVQTSGDFLMEFVVEKSVRDGTEERAVSEEGIGDVIQDDTEFYIQREKQVGVLMTQNQALQSASWVIANLLGDYADTDDIKELMMEEYSEAFE